MALFIWFKNTCEGAVPGQHYNHLCITVCQVFCLKFSGFCLYDCVFDITLWVTFPFGFSLGFLTSSQHPKTCQLLKSDMLNCYILIVFYTIGVLSIQSYGLVNTPAVFQSFMNYVFWDMLNRFIIVYLDNILIHLRTYHKHIKHVSQVLR